MMRLQFSREIIEIEPKDGYHCYKAGRGRAELVIRLPHAPTAWLYYAWLKLKSLRAEAA